MSDALMKNKETQNHKMEKKTFKDYAGNIMIRLYEGCYEFVPQGLSLNLKKAEKTERYSALPYLYALAQYDTEDCNEVVIFENIWGQKEDYTDAKYLVGYLVANLIGCTDKEVIKEVKAMSDLCNGYYDEYITEDEIIEDPSLRYTKREYVVNRVLPKFEALTGVKVREDDISEDERGLIHINPYEGDAGWCFGINDPENFWFENIDSYSYNFVDFDEIVELMKWVAEDIKDYNIEED